MRVRDLCRREVVTVEPATLVSDAARLMEAQAIGCVVVLQHGDICGILTDRDIVVRGVRHGRDLRTLPVSELMTRDPVVIEVDADLAKATVRMAEKGVRRLPVVDAEARLFGLLSLDDAIVLVGDEMANLRAAITAAISR